MNIHDLVFAVGSVLLTASLVPGIWGKIQTPLWVGLSATLVIGAFTVNYLTMGYVFTAVICGAQTVLWGLIARRAWRVRESRLRGSHIL